MRAEGRMLARQGAQSRGDVQRRGVVQIRPLRGPRAAHGVRRRTRDPVGGRFAIRRDGRVRSTPPVAPRDPRRNDRCGGRASGPFDHKDRVHLRRFRMARPSAVQPSRDAPSRMRQPGGQRCPGGVRLQSNRSARRRVRGTRARSHRPDSRDRSGTAVRLTHRPGFARISDRDARAGQDAASRTCRTTAG